MHSATPSPAIRRCLEVIRPTLSLAPRAYLDEVRDRLTEDDIQAAVANHDTAAVFDWIVGLLDRQGISNAAAIGFAATNGSARWQDVSSAVSDRPRCPKLRSHWHFEDCSYRKGAQACARPDLLPWCPVPAIPARKGALAQAAFSFAMFIRDVCDGDLIRWIDERLATTDPGKRIADRTMHMRAAILGPLINIVGTGPKVWAMVLAELLLAGDPQRERWIVTGASFVAVDSLVHAYLRRTGILRRLEAEHPYGAACYAPGGCAEVIEIIAHCIDAREFNPAFPACFPRWVQFAIWWFCAADGWDICNANRVDDRAGCRQRNCPAFRDCDRLPFNSP